MSEIAHSLVGRDEILALQAAMAKMPQAVLDTQHFFAEGMYCRFLPRSAGTVIVGKEHKREHFYIVCNGTVRVTDGNGPAREITGPAVIVSQPGTKRAVLAMTDVTCLTVHRTDKTDLDEIEAELIEPDDISLFDSSNKLKFDVQEFRALTSSVIAKEKIGFWSDWTPEQRALYTSGDWRAFSESRGYSKEEIDEYGRWRDAILECESKGLQPFVLIHDLATDAALKNIALDTKGEILKSSHAPFVDRRVSL